jgi:S1-C subfamily serine protease
VVLTNHHVIEGSTAVTVTDESTGRTYQAEVVGSDSSRDIAVLKLKDASDLATATIDDDDNLKIGDAVTAVGNSQGGGELMAAAGTVTDLGRTITASGEGGGDSETLSNLIETDADVVSGDSGGALLDSEGEVVGMTTAASAGANPDGYAIDIDDALKIADQIRSGDESGTVSVGASAFLGVQVGSPATGYGASGATGATIAGTVEDSPAAKAGLAAGDTITAVDDTAVNSATDLTDALAEKNPGDSVRITWTTSSGTTHSATVTLAEGPAK